MWISTDPRSSADAETEPEDERDTDLPDGVEDYSDHPGSILSDPDVRGLLEALWE